MTQPTDTTVMVVEDEYLIAAGLEMTLQGAGYNVLEPFPTIEQALAAIPRQRIDLALLDINLDGHRVYPVADALAALKVPFIFLSGCSEGELPPIYFGVTRLMKPIGMETLLTSIERTLQRAKPLTRVGNPHLPPLPPEVRKDREP